MKRARLFEKLDRTGESSDPLNVRCQLCAHRCMLSDNRVGVCGVRKNIKGELFSLNYDRVAATQADPIEKKPLYHFLPGSRSFSVAAMGCNFRCTFCQNNSLSVVRGEDEIYGQAISPDQLVEAALRDGCQSISYTYSEPTVYYELMYETAALAKEKGIKNVMVTNGYMSGEALEEIAPFMDAANVDLKSFSDDFYKKYCGGRLAPVLETIKGMKEKGVWVEVTTLLIPGLNDDKKETRELISFIAGVDEDMPWHVSRFYPQHLMLDVPPTGPRAIEECLEMGAGEGLRYLYAGNLRSDRWEDTRCPACGELLIQRSGYCTEIGNFPGGRCGSCSREIAGVWGE
jgi:pyruvate formate lyase activating enzyme